MLYFNHDAQTRGVLVWKSSMFCLLTAVSALAGDVQDALRKPTEWFASAPGRETTAAILSWQASNGAWPKNQNNAAQRFTGDPAALKGTFDNGATTDELRYLSRAFASTQDPTVLKALERGIDHILAAQYPNGGWPQYHPPGTGYHRHITFNDNAMVRLLEFLREVAGSESFAAVDPARRHAAKSAFAKGIECIQKCQIRTQGVLSGWCAQHDEIDFSPRPARTFELASLSGCETVGIVRLLMSLETPTPEIVAAVEGAAAWLERAALKGIRVESEKLADGTTDKKVVADPAAPPLWARFYDLKTGQPFFCDRDGVPRNELSALGFERRNGYAWYGTWPAKLLSKDLPAWRERLAKK